MDIEAIRAALRPFVEQTEALSAEIDGYFDADKDPPRDLYYKLADLDTEMVAIVLPHVTPPTLEACDAIIDLLPDGFLRSELRVTRLKLSGAAPISF